MRISVLSFVATLVSIAAAQGPNALNVPSGGLTGFSAGNSQDIKWSNPQGSTVTIKLRQGTSNNLGEGTTIADHIKNTGSYTWSVPKDITAGDNYALEIIDDDNPNLINYSPLFAIASPNSAKASGSSASETGSSTKSSASKTSGTSSSASSAMTSGSTSSASGSSASGSTPSPTSSGAAVPIGEVSNPLLALALGVAAFL